MALPPTDWYFKDKTFLPGTGHGWIGHRSAALTLVVFGRLKERFRGQVHQCTPWEVHFKPRGEFHETAAGPEGVRMFVLGLRGEGVERTLPDKPMRMPAGTTAMRIFGQFLRLAKRPQAEVPLSDRMLSRLVEGLGSDRLSVQTKTSRPCWITEVHEAVGRRGGADQSLEELARRFRVHPVYLARAFRRYYGCSIGSQRRTLRLRWAIELLVSDQDSLADVALELGYADQSHLTRDFKRETGWTPGQFRKTAGEWHRLGTR
ncbi:MAG: AraC family transcriptional regulator [Acidobacteriota bacterium]